MKYRKILAAAVVAAGVMAVSLTGCGSPIASSVSDSSDSAISAVTDALSTTGDVTSDAGDTATASGTESVVPAQEIQATEITSSPTVSSDSQAESAASSAQQAAVTVTSGRDPNTVGMTKDELASLELGDGTITAAASGTTGVLNGGVNVRESAGGQSRVLTTIVAGEKVQVLAYEGNWMEISYNGTVGWVYSTWVNSDTDASHAGTKTADADEEDTTTGAEAPGTES